MESIDFSTLPSLWDDDELYMVSALAWPEKMPASALKYAQHFRRTELTDRNRNVFKDFIAGCKSAEESKLESALYMLTVDIDRSKKCLLATTNQGT